MRPGPYGDQWRGTRLLEIRKDSEIGVIRSPVLVEYGELNLGAERTLEAFVRYGSRIDADRYLFAIFAHGRGVIDTRVLGPTQTGPHKRLSFSSDDTSRSQLSLSAFHRAIKRGLAGKRFEAMVFLTCLANMVEVAYEFQDVTHFLVASPDEIRIVNQPPGRFQIRGIPLEHMAGVLAHHPHTDVASLGREMVDAFIKQYQAPVSIVTREGALRTHTYGASLALIDCRTLGGLTDRLNHLAELLTEQLAPSPSADKWLAAIDHARRNTRRYPSFLNLEYYDLADLLHHLNQEIDDPRVHDACGRILAYLQRATIVYERHTAEAPSSGLAIYFSHGLVPENIYRSHQAQYRQTRFSQETQWDELVDALRRRGG